MRNEQVAEFVSQLKIKPMSVQMTVRLEGGRQFMEIHYEWKGPISRFSAWCQSVISDLDTHGLVVRSFELGGPGELSWSRHSDKRDEWHAFPKVKVQTKAELTAMDAWFEQGIKEIINRHKKP